MRYYDIQLLKPGTSTIVKRWQSFPNGVFNPAAQNVLMDFMLTAEDTPLGGSSLKIEGVSLDDLKQSTQYGAQKVGGKSTPGLDIRVFGGMGKGLPLANPAQQGLILAGTVWQSYGNWEGVNQSLDMVIFPALAFVQPVNLTFNWLAGTPLSQALAATFSNAFPGYKQVIQISPNRKLSYTQPGVYSSVDRFAAMIRRLTEGQLSANDPGVSIIVQNGAVYAVDGTAQTTPKQLNFYDLIGQPTWLTINQIQIKTVMRGDILVGDVVELPNQLSGLPGQVIQTNPITALPGLRQNSIFTGKFHVNQIRQIGNFRSPNGADWCTIMNCVSLEGAS